MTSSIFTYVEISSKSKATSLEILILKHVYFCNHRIFSCVTLAKGFMLSIYHKRYNIWLLPMVECIEKWWWVMVVYPQRGYTPPLWWHFCVMAAIDYILTIWCFSSVTTMEREYLYATRHCQNSGLYTIIHVHPIKSQGDPHCNNKRKHKTPTERAYYKSNPIHCAMTTSDYRLAVTRSIEWRFGKWRFQWGHPISHLSCEAGG
jgi:hypothetical protein